MKASNILQSTTIEAVQVGGSAASNIVAGVTNAVNTSAAVIGSPVVTTTPAGIGTPLRSRNQSRLDKQQQDEKSETTSTLKGKAPPKPPEEFYKDLQQFHEKRGTPIRNIPRITGNEVDLHRIYCEVIERGGFQKVNMRDEWDEVLSELGWKEKIVNGSAGLKYIYRRFLEKYERLNYFGEDPDKIDALDGTDLIDIMGSSVSGRSNRGVSRYPTSVYGYSASAAAAIHNVPMTYNYKQHHVNIEKRRQFKLSTDLHKASPYEKLMLSLLSPLPNEQDFAINACTLMANESKHTLKLNDFPKLMDALIAHTGVFSDYTMRNLFQHIYSGVRRHSLYGFWYDLLNDRPQILELYTDEQAVREGGLVEDGDDSKNYSEEEIWSDSKELDFLNLGRGLGTQDHIGQRVLQVMSIVRNLSFFEENLTALVKNKTLLRFLVMSSNIRWGNIHIQALETTGNIAVELDLVDPSVDDLSRCLMATICEGIEGPDRGVIINCLEILYKLCQRDTNEDYILKCLTSKFYNTISLYLSLNDIMLLLFTLEAIYALTCLGSKSCHSMLQVRGIIDQLVSLISVEAQSYGPDGCILMRVVETVPGNMLPMVAQNIANLQTAAVIQKSNTHHHIPSPGPTKPQIVPMIQPDITEVPVAPPVTAGMDHSQPAQIPAQINQNFTHEDEQYALVWLGATFERTPKADSHIEQQELYRMYLSHCQKSGKNSVINHIHFPRLVRLIFTNLVGPAIVRKSDGTELPGLYYVSIRLRSHPLPLQQKPVSQNLPSNKQGDQVSPLRKLKKKPLKSLESPVNPLYESSLSATDPNEDSKMDIANTSSNVLVSGDKKTNFELPKTLQLPVENKINEKVEAMEVDTKKSNDDRISESISDNADPLPNTEGVANIQNSQTQTSLIKSLLANKVSQRQQKHKDIITTSNTQAMSSQTSTVSASLVTSPLPQPIKVPSTAISALVNNPLMQNTSVKVGQTTIKPLNPQMSVEKKQIISESTPPPLAPLSGANVAKDASGRPIIIANQMLVDILDKKGIDSSIGQKRKIEDPNLQNKRQTLEISAKKDSSSMVMPSKNAANLYAEMAASILEDEDLEEFSSTPSGSATHSQTITDKQSSQPHHALILPSKVQTTAQAVPVLQNVQRQLLFQTNQTQLKLTQSPTGTTSQQIPNAMATIKTDQGLQTVPVILHQKPMESTQQTQTQILQQVMQQAPPPPTQTQYVLATNQQGQTYLVAQQTQPQPPPPPQQPTQTVLVTQTPQQQSTGAKTIIILQQQPIQNSQPQQQILGTPTTAQPQKMIMTTSQGQQVLVTQRPQTPQQIFINPQTATTAHIQSRQIIQSTSGTCSTQPPATSQLQAGQISPSLLNQLNQIPATIKLHQPMPQTPSNARINMNKGGGVSIVQGTSLTPQSSQTTPVAIPQLQQHQSIIQQHIISGPSEKRHVILGGGRAIEIKETLITPAQPPLQQNQLNSQTIIATQAQGGCSSAASTSMLQQQQTQQQVTEIVPPSMIQAKINTTQPSIQPSLPTVILPGGVSTSMAAINKSILSGPPLIKPSLPTVKLPPVVSNAGPPPLTSVNNVVSTVNPTPSTYANQSEKGQYNKNDEKKKASEPASTGGGTLSTTATCVTTTTTTTSSNSSSANNTSTGQTNSSVASTSLPVPSHHPQTSTSITTSSSAAPPQPQLSAAEAQWLYICDWRNCPRKKFKSLSDLQHHVCTVHAPDHLDSSAEIFCQWGIGPALCDGIPRKRFSLMTHLLDRHLIPDALRAAVQRRISTGMHNIAPTKPPVTIVRNIELSQRPNVDSALPANSSASNSTQVAPGTTIGSSALQAIKRHTAEIMNSKELMDENEGPVTKSIRLTAALILRNLVIYTTTAKKNIRRHEPHLANVALSNVESSGTVCHILYEMNN